MIKLLTIIGARPQIIKAAALSRAIQKEFDNQVTERDTSYRSALR